jgi:predicted nucleic acid-binding protein
VFLIDTNILLRAAQPSHPMHASAVRALSILMEREERLVVAIQNIAECWNVFTRPVAQNGLGFTIEAAQAEVDRLEGFFEIVSETPETYRTWKSLVIAAQVKGAQVHDARLVSVMQVYAIPQLLTFNVDDFARFSGIEAIHPDKLA